MQSVGRRFIHSIHWFTGALLLGGCSVGVMDFGISKDTTSPVNISAGKAFAVQAPAESDVVSSYRVFRGSCLGANQVTISYPANGASGPTSAPCNDESFAVGVNLYGADGLRRLTFTQDGKSLDRNVSYQKGGLNFGSGIDGTVWAFARDSSRNQIYVAGEFGQFAQYPTAKNLIRLNADGSIDATFLKAGEGFNGTVRALEWDPTTGALYVGGDFTVLNKNGNLYTQNRLAKLLPDGSPDLTFIANSSSRGVTSAGGSIRALHFRSGILYFGGSFSGFIDSLNTTLSWANFGAINSFGIAQTAFWPSGSSVSGSVSALAADTTGFLYLGGQFTYVKGVPRSNFARVSLNVGNVDTTFSTAGANGSVFALAVDPVNSRLFVGGNFTTLSGTTALRVGAVDLTAVGNVPTTWSTQLTGVNGMVSALSYDANAQMLYLGGLFNQINYGPSDANSFNPNSVVRINLTGSTVAPDLGWVRNPYGFDGAASAILVDPDASNPGIYVGGAFNSYKSPAGITRIKGIARIGKSTDAPIDLNFQGNGSGTSGSVLAIANDRRNGKVYLGGNFQTINSGNPGNAVVIQNFITRLNADGTIDTTFINPGEGFNSTVYALALDTVNDKIYVGGGFTSYYTRGTAIPQNRITRLNLDGTVDSTFIAAGGGFDETVRALALDSANSAIYVGGLFSSYTFGATAAQSRIAKLSTTGVLDTGFNPAGGGFDNTVLALTFDPASNKLYVGGSFTQYTSDGVTIAQTALSRLRGNGGVDTTFMAISDNLSGGAVKALAWNPSTGRLYVGGAFYLFIKNGNAPLVQKGLMAMRADGTADLAFVADGYGAPSGYVNVLAFQTPAVGPATLMVGGTFSSFSTLSGNQALNGIAQLKLSDGSLTQFIPSLREGFNSSAFVYAIGPTANDEIWVGGTFNSYNRTLVGTGLARFLGDGSLASK